MIYLQCSRNLVSNTCKNGRIHTIVNVQYICNLETGYIQYFCVDLLFTVNIKMSWSCEEISFLMLLSKVIKYNVVAIIAVFLEANYSDESDHLEGCLH